ncbi:hypothetical protein DNTS_029372 [Danionella cerebrum]|uniref:VLIG-type G domain-containing protein n=1 Tax=Danionella cerebrum TaxID=2873325 RepID=A0A553N5H2_9TELE|nr:hypothetical protein DNTS_029372 [Danionella translucida]
MKEDAQKKISEVQSVCKMATPMVFFFKFDSQSFSKSQLMNNLINEKQNIFFHRDCTGGGESRVLMDGVVEIAWFCPSGKPCDTLSQCVAFCNLHGDAGDNSKQLQILTKILEDLSKQSGIRVDEECDGDCWNGKGAAQKMIGLIDQKKLTEIKESFLPHQGELWHRWCEKNKELHRSQQNEMDIQIKQNELKKIRVLQNALEVSDFMKLFIEEMHSNPSDQKRYFLKWLTILFDEFTSNDLSALHEKYFKKWSEAKAVQQGGNEHVELDQLSKEIQAASFGLEHIMREMGQIYESCKSLNKSKDGLPSNFSSLPSLAADIMISGFPLELMDGDAAHIPVLWVTAVIQDLIQKLENKRVFVLSVLGVQSSGKSTMLNAMFGLQFAVSAGRCTRGAFMQLVKVSEELKEKEQLKFDYILVVDTEGLHALELSASFRNTLEISTYRRLETEYSKWSWGLRRTLLDVENKLHNQIENEQINKFEEIDVEENLKEKSDEVKELMSNFFETDQDKDILIQWKESFTIKIKELQESIVRETTRKLNDILQRQEMKKRIDAQRTRNKNILFERSKELAVQLKDKANDETILKKEFDSFWTDCVKKIRAETPQIKEIDVLEDVKQLLSNDSVGGTSERRDIFSVQKFSDYVQSRKSTSELNSEVEIQIRNLVDEIYQDAIKMISSFNIAKKGYDKFYIQDLSEHIKSKVTNCEDLVFSREFCSDLLMSICKRENQQIANQQKKFKEANDPVFYFEKKRENYYSIFQNYLHGATSAAIFGEIICQKMKGPVQKSVYSDTSRDLTNEIQSSCESINGNRCKLEMHILKALAEQENFNKYIDYLFRPRDHARSFIREEISQYIKDNFEKSVRRRMEHNMELMQDKIMKAAHRATLVNTSGDVQKWLNDFTIALSDVLTFSVKDLQGVSHEGVDDLQLLEDVISRLLKSEAIEILHQLSTETFPENLESKDRPEEILIDHLCCCCWVQCPFCGATCTNTVENHSGDHNVLLHRVNGLTGCSYDENEQLSTDFCTTLVKSYKKFYTGQWISCKEYRKAGNVYAEWSITPDTSNLAYWKWFVSRFHRNLENHFEKTFNRWDQISEGWGEFTKEQALESLEEYM